VEEENARICVDFLMIGLLSTTASERAGAGCQKFASTYIQYDSV
jgi:hypothetical protein